MLFTAVLLVWRTRQRAYWWIARRRSRRGGRRHRGRRPAASGHAAPRMDVGAPFALGFVTPGRAGHQLELLIQGYTNLAGGTFWAVH